MSIATGARLNPINTITLPLSTGVNTFLNLSIPINPIKTPASILTNPAIRIPPVT